MICRKKSQAKSTRGFEKKSPAEFKVHEKDYINLNFELGKYISGSLPIPITYFTDESNKRLDSLIEKTEELLKSLIKSNQYVAFAK